MAWMIPALGREPGERPVQNTRFLEWAAAGRRRSVAGMSTGARSPEELEVLFEDAFVTRDAHALSAMFADGAVLALRAEADAARGAAEIGRLAVALWEADLTYIAAPRRVVQARDVALVLADSAINVARRGGDGAWAYAIALLSFDPTTTKEGR
jgi:ketosteroid isomerase-like protein